MAYSVNGSLIISVMAQSVIAAILAWWFIYWLYKTIDKEPLDKLTKGLIWAIVWISASVGTLFHRMAGEEGAIVYTFIFGLTAALVAFSFTYFNRSRAKLQIIENNQEPAPKANKRGKGTGRIVLQLLKKVVLAILGLWLFTELVSWALNELYVDKVGNIPTEWRGTYGEFLTGDPSFVISANQVSIFFHLIDEENTEAVLYEKQEVCHVEKVAIIDKQHLSIICDAASSKANNAWQAEFSELTGVKPTKHDYSNFIMLSAKRGVDSTLQYEITYTRHDGFGESNKSTYLVQAVSDWKPVAESIPHVPTAKVEWR